jgi:hypothetical protein
VFPFVGVDAVTCGMTAVRVVILQDICDMLVPLPSEWQLILRLELIPLEFLCSGFYWGFFVGSFIVSRFHHI